MNWHQRRLQQIRRRRLKQAALILAGGLGTLYLLGLLLPAEQVRAWRVHLARPPEAVWRVLTDLDGMPLWRSDVGTLERLPDVGGMPVWREGGHRGVRVLSIAEATPPRRLVTQGAGEGRLGLPRRTIDLRAADGGTELTVTERSETKNPLRRLFTRLHLAGSGVDRFLHDLELRLDPTRRQVAADRGP